MLIRLRFRFGVLAALCAALSVFGSCNVLERTALPAYDARLDSMEGGMAQATVTGHGRIFATHVSLGLIDRNVLHVGDTMTVHCEESPFGELPTCFSVSRVSGLALTALFGLASLLAAAWLLRPWWPGWARRGSAPP